MPVLPQVPIRYVERNRQMWADVTVHESDGNFHHALPSERDDWPIE